MDYSSVLYFANWLHCSLIYQITMNEDFKIEMLEAFGYKPEDMNCSDADTAFSEIFQDEHFSDPVRLLECFIANCSDDRFKSLRKQIKKGV